MKKIAVVTNNGKTISQHFGRSRYYQVFTIENGEIVENELRERTAGHFGGHNHHHHHHTDGHSHGEGRHGYDAESVNRHAMMAQQISDCEALIAGGMGMGAYEHLKAAGLTVILTDIRSIEDAINLYAEGKLENLFLERTH